MIATVTSLVKDILHGTGHKRWLTLLRLKNQLRQSEASETFSNRINPKYLSEMDVIMLKRVSATISDHLNRLAIDFRIS